MNKSVSSLRTITDWFIKTLSRPDETVKIRYAKSSYIAVVLYITLSKESFPSSQRFLA